MSLVPTVSCLFFAKIKNHLAENVNFERNINSSIESPEMSCMIQIRTLQTTRDSRSGDE